jgi:hypothetical protein
MKYIFIVYLSHAIDVKFFYNLNLDLLTLIFWNGGSSTYTTFDAAKHGRMVLARDSSISGVCLSKAASGFFGHIVAVDKHEMQRSFFPKLGPCFAFSQVSRASILAPFYGK